MSDGRAWLPKEAIEDDHPPMPDLEIDARIAAAKHNKEMFWYEREPRPFAGDLPFTVEIERDGRAIARIHCRQPNRDEMLRAAEIAVKGYRADAVWLTVDTFQGLRDTNPLTGKRWGANEMQAAAAKLGLEAAGVSEALSLVAVFRNGRHVCAILPYETTGKQLVWRDDRRPPVMDTHDPAMAGLRVLGFVDEVLDSFFEGDYDLLTTALELAPEFGITTGDVVEHHRVLRWHADMAVLRFLMEQPEHFAVAMAAENPEHAALIQRSVTEMQVALQRPDYGLQIIRLGPSFLADDAGIPVEMVEDLLDTIPEPLAVLLRLRYGIDAFFPLSVEELAEKLKKKPAKVRAILARAIEELRMAAGHDPKPAPAP